VRIVFDPEQMTRTARLMTEAAEDYATRGSRLLTAERPVMPPDIAARIEGGLRSAAASLDDTSLRLEAEAVMLRIRASLVGGDMGVLALSTLGRFSTSLDGGAS
jgi:hypothetical protein